VAQVRPKARNIGTSWRRKILRRDATICWRWPLTTPIGRAYNPATERGDALATRPRHLFAPRKLLITMSDSTADNSRLLFVVGWDLREPSRSGRVGSKRSRAVWQVKMKKEKRGRRSPCVVSNTWKLRFSSFEAGRKTSAVHVYIGYTIVVRDVNRRR